MLDQNNAIDAAIGAFIIPNVVGLISGCGWPGWIKSLMTVVLSLLVGLLRVWLTGQLNTANFATAATVVLVSAGVSYQTVTKELAKKFQEVGPVK